MPDLAGGVEIKFTGAMYPANPAVLVSDNPVLVVEIEAFADDLILQVACHPLAVFRMNQGQPALRGTGVSRIDPENLVENGGAGPPVGQRVEMVMADSGQLLRLQQAGFAAQQCLA